MTEYLWLMASEPWASEQPGYDASRVLTAKLPAGARSLKNPDNVQDPKQGHGRQQVSRDAAHSGRMSEHNDKRWRASGLGFKHQ